MHTLIYDGTYHGFLCAVFDVYEYKFVKPEICTNNTFKGNIFENVHQVALNEMHSDRVQKGLKKKISAEAFLDLYRAFLSELPGIENTLLQFIQYVFASATSIEKDFSHPAVLTIANVVKKVRREKHRMEAFVRFQKTGDGLFYAIIDPDYNVLPLITRHFKNRYADQKWVIYDSRRRYGVHYNGSVCTEVEINFSEQAQAGKNIAVHFDEQEELYQKLWNAYFTNVNIAARKNTKLHLQHVPRRYWKYLTEKQPGW